MRSSPSIAASARIRSARPRPPSLPRVHVLAEQDDLARAAFDQRLRLGDDVVPRPRDLGAAGVGHDAIGAEFVAAFLDGEEGAGRGAAARGQRVELGQSPACRCRPAGAPRAASATISRQAVIGLRADDDVDHRRARLGFGALGLGDAAGERDQRLRPVVAAQAADVRIGLFGGFLADVAGVEHDQVGVLAVGGRGHAVVAEQLGHALAVIDVHLAAEGFDAEGLGGASHRAGL